MPSMAADRRVCAPGDVGVIPGDIEHEAWFPEDAEVVDVFAPPGEDSSPGRGAPTYMQKGWTLTVGLTIEGGVT